MSSRHEKRLNELFILAQDVAPIAAARIAAAIFIGNRLISFGTNSSKTSPFQKRFGKNKESICIHAEIDALKNALKKVSPSSLENATIYVARAKKNEKKEYIPGIAKPCEGCARALSHFGIKSAYFTLNDEGFDFL